MKWDTNRILTNKNVETYICKFMTFPMYMLHNRRGVDTDVECQLCTRKLEREPAISFRLDHQAGKARLEMLAGFENVSKTEVEDIFEALRETWG